MKLKPGVRLNGIKPEMLAGLMIAQSVFADREMVITSVTDGKHSRGSLHYAGMAVDLRRRHLGVKDAELVLAALKDALGADFDASLESTHFHIEYQPKLPYSL